MIREGMAEYKALSFAANALLERMAALHYEMVNMFLRGEVEGPLMFPERAYLSDLKALQADPQLSGTDLAAMVSQHKAFWVEFMYNQVRREVRAEYKAEKDDGNRTQLVRIVLYFTRDFLGEIKSAFDGRSVTKQTLFNFLWVRFGSSLVHELRHAVDDHRFQDITRNGERVFQGLQPINSPAFKFKQKYREKVPSKEFDADEWMEYHKTYLRMPHEVWARFSQLVHATKFKDEHAEVEYALMPDGSRGITYTMRPLGAVLGGLKGMYGWEALEEPQRRRLTRALSSLWHEEAKWVEQNNKEVARHR